MTSNLSASVDWNGHTLFEIRWGENESHHLKKIGLSRCTHRGVPSSNIDLTDISKEKVG